MLLSLMTLAQHRELDHAIEPVQEHRQGQRLQAIAELNL